MLRRSLLLLLAFTTNGYAAISITPEIDDNFEDATDGTMTTASLSPASGSVLYFTIGLSSSGAIGSPTVGVSGLSGTCAQVTSAGQIYGSRRYVGVVRCTKASAWGTGIFTITVTAGSLQDMGYVVDEVAGADDADPDDTAVAGSAVNADDTLTLGDVGTVDAGDVVFVAAGYESGASSLAATGYTELSQLGGLSNIRQLVTWWDDSTPDETPDLDGAGSGNGLGGIAFVINVGSGASAPTLSAPTPSGTLATQTTATLGATSDDSTGTFYGVVDDSAGIMGITASQIKLGNDSGDATAIASCNDTVSSTSPSCAITGLTANTAYSYAVVHTNTTGDSNVETGTFTTAEESSTAIAVLDYYRRLLTQ